MKYECMLDGFKTRGYIVNSPGSEKWMSVSNGEILECDGEYIVKDGVALCHKDSVLGKVYFRKVYE